MNVADPFQPVRQGQPLKSSARTFNGLQKAGQDYSRRKLNENQTQNRGPEVPQAVRVYNGLSYALNEFSVVQTNINAITVDPAAVPFEAASAPVFNAIAPAADGRPFFITREPIPVGAIGDVVANGPAVAWIDVTNEAHKFAAASAGIVDCLVSSASAGVPILWKESGTGLRKAEVLIGSTGGGMEIDGAYASNGAALYFPVTTTPTMVPPGNTLLAAGVSYLILANITGQGDAGGFVFGRLVSGPVAGWPTVPLTQHGGMVNMPDIGGFQAIHIPVGPFAEDRYIAWEVYAGSGAPTGKVYGLLNSFTGLFQAGNTSIYSIRT